MTSAEISRQTLMRYFLLKRLPQVIVSLHSSVSICTHVFAGLSGHCEILLLCRKSIDPETGSGLFGQFKLW